MRRIYMSLTVPSPAPNIFGTIDRTLLKTSRRHINASKINEPQLATTFFNQFPTYCQMVEEAKKRARRSILIDHNGVAHIPLDQFSNVEQVYTIERDAGSRGTTNLSLIEFLSEKDAEEVTRQARHNEDRLMPVPMKIFRYPVPSNALEPSKQNLPYPVTNVRLPNRKAIDLNLKNYSDLVAKNTMSLVALKMRFVTLVNLEQILCSGLFGAYELMPFGSAVIDTGSDSGDLDLVITRKQDHSEIISETLSRRKSSPRPEPLIKLLHLDRSIYSQYSSDTFGEMAAMRFFATLIKSFMPLTDKKALLILHAKVPIIRFKALITAIDCDLSFNLGLDNHRNRDILTTSYSGIVMSQILYDLCRKNNLFTAVVIYLRIFARITSITSKGSNVGFTNFQLLSLIIFYLQQISLHPRSLSISHHDKDRIVQPFKQIMNSRPIHLNDNELNVALPKVIKGFFEFYANKIEFKGNRSLNLYNSKLEKQPDNSILYVVNPLDGKRNVCHNVCRKGLNHFVGQCRLANEMLSDQNPRECPLSLINGLLAEHQQNSMKSRAYDWGEVMFDGDDMDLADQPPKRLLDSIKMN